MENRQTIEVELLDVWGTDETIANSAWVSTAKQNKDRTDTDISRVVSQMIPSDDVVDHGTPLESVWLRDWIRCPIYVERQFDKYRMTQQYQDFKVEYDFGPMGRDNITQNELSLRYRTMPNSFIDIPTDVRNISKRVGDILLSDMDGESNTIYYDAETDLNKIYEEVMTTSKQAYDRIVSELFTAKNEGRITYNELKRAREFYRGILGTGFFTDMQIVLNANALKNILTQRLSKHTQPEARKVAELMLQEALKEKKINNMLNTAYEKYNWYVDFLTK